MVADSSNDTITGFYDPRIQDGLAVYPNPFENHLDLLTNRHLSYYECRVTDNYGRQVYSNRLFGNKNRIELPGLSNGVYVLNIYGPDGMEYRRILIKNSQ